jgi:O-antigen/teichoic acid export membrane protein
MHDTIAKFTTRLQNDALLKNSVFLILSSGVQAGLGFGFWLLSAHLYTPGEIGQASALISAMTMISYCSLLGFNSTFIRFLPTSKQKNDKINTGIILVLATGFVMAIGYVLLLPVVAPKLAFVRQSPGLSLGFVVMGAFAAINLLTDSIFIAYRASKYNLYVYTGMSIAKLALPLGLVWLGGYGVFAAQGAAGIFALLLSTYYLVRHFDYRPKLTVNRQVVRTVRRFSFGNYIANLLNILPPVVLPIIIINRLGADAAGYYYLAFMVATLLYTVAYSVSNSLFAEGSYAESGLARLIKRSALIMGGIMIPGSLALAAIGPLLLKIFGKSYGTEGASLIVMLAAAGPAVAFYITATVLMRITKQLGSLIVVNAVYAALILGLAMLWAQRGLPWIAAAWLIGHFVGGVLATGMLVRFYRSPTLAVESVESREELPVNA